MSQKAKLPAASTNYTRGCWLQSDASLSNIIAAEEGVGIAHKHEYGTERTHLVIKTIIPFFH